MTVPELAFQRQGAEARRVREMDEALFGRVDWQRPWLAPLRSIGSRIVQAADWREALNAEAARIDLRNHRQLPIQFVPQCHLPSNMAYEQFISQTGCVPTRKNLHDFFNALVWLTFPKIKIQLNALQAAEIERVAAMRGVDTADMSKSSVSRGKLRDAATIFDENAALLMTSEAGLIDALRMHDWREVFISRRKAFGPRCELRLFGHALMEKLVSPYKSITAHVWLLPVGAPFFAMTEEGKGAWMDDVVAQRLNQGMTMRDFTPLPVLGIPGWWPGQNEAFYEDASVFRPKKLQAPFHKNSESDRE